MQNLYYVPKEKVFEKAKELNAIPYDIPGVEYSSYGDVCTFDFIIKKHNLTDPELLLLSKIIRGQILIILNWHNKRQNLH